MTINLYVMPLIGGGTSAQDARRPKYRDSLFPTLNWGMFDYGDEPWCLVGILDVPPATDTALDANPDVFKLPADLEQTMGSTGVRNTVRNRLEAVNIPGTWVQTSTTYREVVLVIGACCQFAQRYQGSTGGPWFGGAVTLASTYDSLPQATRDGIFSAAQSFGFDTSGVTGANTLRQILLNIADQYTAAGQPLVMSGISLYIS